jgi:hypothetical protein
MTKAMLLSLVCVTACTTPDPAELDVWSNSATVGVVVYRAWDHDFHGATATINGVGAGALTIEPGHEGTIGNPESRASATFSIPNDLLGTALHVEVNDGGERLVVDAPDALAARSLDVQTNLDQPLTGDQAITVATNIAADAIDDSSVVGIFIADHVCAFAAPAAKRGDAWAFQLAPGFGEWLCGTPPAAGTELEASLDLTINMSASATCSSADCHVSPLGSGIEKTIPIRLQF